MAWEGGNDLRMGYHEGIRGHEGLGCVRGYQARLIPPVRTRHVLVSGGIGLVYQGYQARLIPLIMYQGYQTRPALELSPGGGPQRLPHDDTER